tara:strand:+ start:404 stop:535 length:132 start_codon:yes stop_codon:yes gene_type:complete
MPDQRGREVQCDDQHRPQKRYNADYFSFNNSVAVLSDLKDRSA